jgi:hypothetical protein
LLRHAAVTARIDPIVRCVQGKLGADRSAVMAWEPIPLPIYGVGLPDDIRSSWVFIVRAGATTGAERHPNSHQRVMAFRGCGDLQVWRDDGWASNLLEDDPGAPLERRWASIPRNVWHQAVVPDEDWVVVSFHTVTAHELIEERPESVDLNVTHQRHYLPADAHGRRL